MLNLKPVRGAEIILINPGHIVAACFAEAQIHGDAQAFVLFVNDPYARISQRIKIAFGSSLIATAIVDKKEFKARLSLY
jgi:hypothetical protein